MQEVAKSWICVSSFTICLKLNSEVSMSILDPSEVAISFWYQPFIVELKSPNTTIRNGLLFTTCSKLSSKFFMKLSNSQIFCLARRPAETDKIVCFVVNFNLNVNIFLKIWYVYDFRRQWIFVVQAHTLAFCICGKSIHPSKIITGYL